MRRMQGSDLPFPVKKGSFDAVPYGGFISPTSLYGAKDLQLRIVGRQLVCSIDYSEAFTKPIGDCRSDARGFERYIHHLVRFEIRDGYATNRFRKALRCRKGQWDSIILSIRLKKTYQFECSNCSIQSSESLVFYILSEVSECKSAEIKN